MAYLFSMQLALCMDICNIYPAVPVLFPVPFPPAFFNETIDRDSGPVSSGSSPPTYIQIRNA